MPKRVPETRLRFDTICTVFPPDFQSNFSSPLLRWGSPNGADKGSRMPFSQQLFAKFVSVEHFKEFLLRTTFVTFVMSVFAGNIGIIPKRSRRPKFLGNGQKTKTRLVLPRGLRPGRNFAA